MKQFIKWYNTDNSTMMPVPSNKMGFWTIVIILFAAIVKLLQLNNV